MIESINRLDLDHLFVLPRERAMVLTVGRNLRRAIISVFH